MAGWALRVSVRAASPASRISSTSQPRRCEAHRNGQPAGSSAHGAPLPLAMRPWPGKVNAVFSCIPSIVPALTPGAKQSRNLPAVLTGAPRRTVAATLVVTLSTHFRGEGACPSIRASGSGYRRRGSGCLTRFDVLATRRTVAFWHYSLAGDLAVEEERDLGVVAEQVRCRWCGSDAQVEVVPTFGAATTLADPGAAP